MEKIMNKLSLIILIGLLFFMLVLVILQQIKIINLDYELVEEKMNTFYYENKYYKVCSKNKRSKITTNEDVIEAVKYAMKKAHPDNGGTSEEFRKFRQLYTELTN